MDATGIFSAAVLFLGLPPVSLLTVIATGGATGFLCIKFWSLIWVLYILPNL